eukprot:TRINITY_DN29570_c0_g1_i3.p1 TRINITY_DN29570_c0_g1~~TRINITY_DN29570_c0_g1_i3.p1  ORF type:complete len:405 (+),score=110.13 TRINITY_DN29570_c0_g1_i3:165-1379(+)
MSQDSPGAGTAPSAAAASAEGSAGEGGNVDNLPADSSSGGAADAAADPPSAAPGAAEEVAAAEALAAARAELSPERLKQVQRLTGSLLGRYKALQRDFEKLSAACRSRDARIAELEQQLRDSEEDRQRLAADAAALRMQLPEGPVLRVGDVVRKCDGGRTQDVHVSEWVLESGECAEVVAVDADGDVRLRNPRGEESGWHYSRFFAEARGSQRLASPGRHLPHSPGAVRRPPSSAQLAAKQRALREAMLGLLRADEGAAEGVDVAQAAAGDAQAESPPPAAEGRTASASAEYASPPPDASRRSRSAESGPQFRSRRPPPHLSPHALGWRQPIGPGLRQGARARRSSALPPPPHRPGAAARSVSPPAVHPGHYQSLQPARRGYTPKSFPCARSSPRRTQPGLHYA